MRPEITQAIANAALEIFRANEQERRSPVEIVNILQVHLGPVIQAMETDAARYQFLRDNKSRGASLKMDGSRAFHFGTGWPALIGKTLDGAVDSAMDEVRKSQQPGDPA